MPRLDAILRKYIQETFGERLSRSYIIKLLEQGVISFKGEVIKRKGLKFPASYIDKFQYNNDLIKAAIAEYQKGLDLSEQSILWDQSMALGDIKLDKRIIDKAFDLRPYIVFEDQDFILTYKPAGVLSHPDKFGDPNNMVFAFIKYMSSVHKSLPRAGLLHRLDKQTQGLLLFAKNMKAYNHVKQQFMAHQLHKLYLVAFKIPKNLSGKAKHIKKLFNNKKLKNFFTLWHTVSRENILNQSKAVFDYVLGLDHLDLFGYIAQHRSRRFSRFEETQDRLKTKYYLRIKDARSIMFPLGNLALESASKIEDFGDLFNIMSSQGNPHNFPTSDTQGGMSNIGIAAIRLITGRTHQIRAQLRYLGIPVLNDHLYGRYTKNTAAIIPSARAYAMRGAQNGNLSSGNMFLLAFGLSFNNLANIRQYFVLPGSFLT